MLGYVVRLRSTGSDQLLRDILASSRLQIDSRPRTIQAGHNFSGTDRKWIGFETWKALHDKYFCEASLIDWLTGDLESPIVDVTFRSPKFNANMLWRLRNSRAVTSIESVRFVNADTNSLSFFLDEWSSVKRLFFESSKVSETWLEKIFELQNLEKLYFVGMDLPMTVEQMSQLDGVTIFLSDSNLTLQDAMQIENVTGVQIEIVARPFRRKFVDEILELENSLHENRRNYSDLLEKTLRRPLHPDLVKSLSRPNGHSYQFRNRRISFLTAKRIHRMNIERIFTCDSGVPGLANDVPVQNDFMPFELSFSNPNLLPVAVITNSENGEPNAIWMNQTNGSVHFVYQGIGYFKQLDETCPQPASLADILNESRPVVQQ